MPQTEERKAYRRAYWLKNRDRLRAYHRKHHKRFFKTFYDSHPEKLAEKREYDRKRALIRNYGITYDEYESMLKIQQNCCLICKVQKDKLNVDHDHTTGKVRGLLCGPCNSLLGMAKDNSGVLEEAIQYLKRF